jgi:predicted ArsR family transcriptional regulator
MTDYPCAKGSPAGLSGLLLRIWTLSDGRTRVGDIAAAVGVTRRQVLDGLDLLDHVGLLAHARVGEHVGSPA